MRLDHTRIPIRERTLTEIMDLALRVMAAMPIPLFLATASMALPLMLLNWALIGWIAGDGDLDTATARYLSLMTILILIEAPLASVPGTLLLGRTMFYEPWSLRQCLAEMMRHLPQILWCQVVLRGVALAWILAAMSRGPQEAAVADICLPILCFCIICVRAFRPYINEIILLERNPLRSRGAGSLTIGRRSASLHNPNSGELVSRWIRSVPVCVLLTGSMVASIWFVQGMLLFDWNWGTAMIHVYIPIALWTVAAFFTVVRFLSYLDLRIRREGWEVELAVRAAASGMVEPEALVATADAK